MKLTLTLTKIAAAAMICITAAGSASGDSFFYACNQFQTVQKLNGDTGAVVDNFTIIGGPGSPCSIAVIGNTGYWTRLGDANVHKVDMTTHVYGGIAFNTGNANFMNGITVDSAQHLWFAHGGSGAGNVLQEFDTAGNLLSTHAFPTAAGSYRDGSVVFNGFVVANRSDQQGPYDKYTIPAGNAPLAYVPPSPGTPFLNDPTQNFGNNGVAFNGVNFYVSNEQLHYVAKYDVNGNYISQAPLNPNSRYENWTFASQDIRPTFDVTPVNATNFVGAPHTICATLTVVSNSVTNVVVGTTVSFNVNSGPNTGVLGASVTDSNGVACFTYIGAGGVGLDTILVSFLDGNSNRHAGTVTKVWVQSSNHPPVARGYAGLVVDANANCLANVSADNGSSDPDAGDTITITQTPPGPYPLGTNIVNLCVTDNHGASNCTTSIIIVRDVTPPNLTCPPDRTVECPADTSPAATGTATASDNCGSSTGGSGGVQPVDVFVGYADDIRVSPFFPSPWAADANILFIGSGSPFDAGAVRIDNRSGGPLVIDDVTVKLCGGGVSYSLWGSFTIPAGFSAILTQTTQYNFDTSDDCVFRACGDPAPAGTEPFPRVYVTIGGVAQQYDDSGHVLDTGGFDLACIGNESLQWRPIGTCGVDCPGGQTNVPVHVTYSDAVTAGTNCAAHIKQVIRRTWTATDASGNSNSCVQTITVQDTTPPNLTCPTNIVVGNDPGQCSAVVNYTVSATDNCAASCEIQVDVYAGFGTAGGGAPYSGLLGSFTAAGVSFATDTGYNWHPLGASEFGADITGCLTAVAEGDYPFTLNSDDGSLLVIDGNLVIDNGGAHGPAGANGTVHLTAGTHTFEVQFFECCGGPSGVDLVLPPGVTYGGTLPVAVVCNPPSGSVFPKGTTTVVCTATDAACNTNTCSFNVTVEDREAPEAVCREGYNPSGKKIPVAGKNPSSGQNPDGYYQLLSKDNCDANPEIYLADTGSAFIAGPFANGDVIKLTQSPGRTPGQDPGAGVVVAHVHLKGDGLLFSVDADGNVSQTHLCLVPRKPK